MINYVCKYEKLRHYEHLKGENRLYSEITSQIKFGAELKFSRQAIWQPECPIERHANSLPILLLWTTVYKHQIVMGFHKINRYREIRFCDSKANSSSNSQRLPSAPEKEQKKKNIHILHRL